MYIFMLLVIILFIFRFSILVYSMSKIKHAQAKILIFPEKLSVFLIVQTLQKIILDIWQEQKYYIK
ncbi:MAG TPA: hypothetical protein DHW78_11090 [Ruminococcaceae bacterium]|nr:hypothetical protein [Oscillospiraceae bacterium]HCM24847.1 hypothetical protein [Oscillospiraceae bacterium]